MTPAYCDLLRLRERPSKQAYMDDFASVVLRSGAAWVAVGCHRHHVQSVHRSYLTSEHVGMQRGAAEDALMEWLLTASTQYTRVDKRSCKVVKQHNTCLMVTPHLVHSGNDSLRDGGAGLDGVVTIGQDLRLHDRHKAVLLADLRIARQPVRVLMDRLPAHDMRLTQSAYFFACACEDCKSIASLFEFAARSVSSANKHFTTACMKMREVKLRSYLHDTMRQPLTWGSWVSIPGVRVRGHQS